MDDEASLLPRKLQAALEQALEQRNEIINQDSDSESDEGEQATDHPPANAGRCASWLIEATGCDVLHLGVWETRLLYRLFIRCVTEA